MLKLIVLALLVGYCVKMSYSSYTCFGYCQCVNGEDFIRLESCATHHYTNRLLISIEPPNLFGILYDTLLIDTGAFKEGNSRLKVLEIEGLPLGNLSKSSFEGLSGLEEFVYHHCDGTEQGIMLNEAVFSAMKNLVRMELKCFVIVNPGSFIGLENLKSLAFDFAGTFSYVLSFSGKQGLFDGLGSLKSLEFQSVYFEEFSENFFRGLYSLENLKFDRCQFALGKGLRAISSGAFNNLTNLLQFSLLNRRNSSSEGVNEFLKNVLSNMPNIESLSLINVHIHDYDPDVFRKNRRLKFVSLANNQLNTLHEHVLNAFPDIGLYYSGDWKLDLRMNPLNCDCSIAWMSHPDLYNHITGAMCEYPEKFEGENPVANPLVFAMCDYQIALFG